MNEFDELLELRNKLIRECQWCRVQTLHCIAKEIKEETEEVIEAIESNDAHEFEEELGDLLWDLLYMAKIAEDNNLFTTEEMIKKVIRKFKRRHPQVYGENTSNMKKLSKAWKETKEKEKQEKQTREKKIITNLRLPSRKDCYEIFSKYKTPNHIIRHCEAVNLVANVIAYELKKNGVLINMALVDRCSLMHDALRYVDFKEIDYNKFEEKVSEEDKRFYEDIIKKYNGVKHGVAVADALNNYPTMASILHKHGFSEIIDGLNTWEEKIVYYADKRVLHDKFVTLGERIEDGRKRYGEEKSNAKQASGLVVKKEKAEKIYRMIYILEKEIFDILGINPEKLNDLLK